MKRNTVELVTYTAIAAACFFGAGYVLGRDTAQQSDVVVLPIYVDSVGVALGVDSLVCKQFKWMEAGDYD